MTPNKEKFNNEIASLGVLNEVLDPLKPAEQEKIKQNILKAISNAKPQAAAQNRWIKFSYLVNFAVATVLGLCLVGGTAFASGNSIPGDLLYPVKLTAEKVELSLALSEQSKTELQAKFALERIDELQKLANKNPGLANTVAHSNSSNNTFSSLGNISGITTASSSNLASTIATSSKSDEIINLNAQARANATTQVNLALSALDQERAELQTKGNIKAAADIGNNILDLQIRAKAQSLDIDNIHGSTQTKQQNLNDQAGAGFNNSQTQNKNQKYKNKDRGYNNDHGQQNQNPSSTSNSNLNGSLPSQPQATTTSQAIIQLSTSASILNPLTASSTAGSSALPGKNGGSISHINTQPQQPGSGWRKFFRNLF